MPAFDAVLLAHYENGNCEALGTLLDRHRPRVSSFVERRLPVAICRRVDADDVVQETELEVWLHIGSFLERRPMPFSTWLLATASQQLAKHCRQHLLTAQRSVRREVVPDDLATTLLSEAESPASNAEKQEAVERVSSLLACLPIDYRIAIELRIFDGLSHQDVAWRLGLSRAAAKKRYARALLRLESLMRKEGLLS